MYFQSNKIQNDEIDTFYWRILLNLPQPNLNQILPELNKSQPVTKFCLNFQKTHGAPTNPIRHVGDLGNIKAEKGRTKVDITDKVASLFGPKDMSVSCTLISGIGHNQSIQVLS